MITRKNLPTVYVYTKDGNIFRYAVDNIINFEELNKFFKEQYGNKLDKIVLGYTIGYINKNKENNSI